MLNSKAFLRYEDLKKRYPLFKALTIVPGWALHLTDTALAGLLVGGWVGAKAISRFAGPAAPRGSTRAGTALFLSAEGFAVAPTRVRSYGFAKQVDRAGVPTQVLAFWDDIFRFEHLPTRILFGVERALVALRAAEDLLDDPPAVIVQQRPGYDLITSWAVHWLRGTPVVFDIDDWIGDYNLFFPIRVRDVLPRCGKLAVVCVVSSERLAQGLAPLFRRVVQIPTFVDVEAFQPRREPKATGEVVFGWNGTVFQDFMFEAVLLMLRAFCRAHDQLAGSVPVRLEIAGTGAYLSKIQALLESKFAGYPITIMGWLDPRTMGEYLDGIDVGLYSLKEKDRYQSAREAREVSDFLRSKSPTKVFEYMAKGIPTISTRLGEAARFLEHGVTGYFTDDEGELAEAFFALARDPALRARMGAAAREQCVAKYSVEAAGRAFADVLSELSNVARAPSAIAHGEREEELTRAHLGATA
jgi:glycosyltransferase involved in cell wall biosynthesis